MISKSSYGWTSDFSASCASCPTAPLAFPWSARLWLLDNSLPTYSAYITAGLRPQYKDVVPQVTVLVKNPNGYAFSVIGKVKSPGTFTPGQVRQRARGY